LVDEFEIFSKLGKGTTVTIMRWRRWRIWSSTVGGGIHQPGPRIKATIPWISIPRCFASIMGVYSGGFLRVYSGIRDPGRCSADGPDQRAQHRRRRV